MSIYQHFRSDEKVFIDSVQQWKESVETFYSPKLTSFLDPREQQILSTIIGKNDDCHVSFYGGYPFAERKRALLYPSYYTPTQEDYSIDLFEISYNRKFNELRHQQILGTVMSLGIKREKFGDVLLSEFGAQLIVSSEISEYVSANIHKIGNAGVVLSKVNLDDIIVVNNTWQQSTVTCSSLRVDSVFSSISNVSRKKAQDCISGGKIKVNHKLIEENDFECHEGDVISVRGFGRYRIMSIDGKTKKEKWKITFGKQK